MIVFMSERKLIDARGAACPGPMMELIAMLKLIEIGDEIELLSNDPGTASDVPTWCQKVGHTLISKTKEEDHWALVVSRAK
jgi:TusA-related sulfurtransferase